MTHHLVYSFFFVFYDYCCFSNINDNYRWYNIYAYVWLVARGWKFNKNSSFNNLNWFIRLRLLFLWIIFFFFFSRSRYLKYISLIKDIQWLILSFFLFVLW